MSSQFDAKAATWDETPHRVALGNAIAGAIAARLPAGKAARLLDYR